MSSANGYTLEVNGHELRASWAAPYFVLEMGYPEEGDEPSLCHCDDYTHALSRLNCGLGENILLNKDFVRVEVDADETYYGFSSKAAYDAVQRDKAASPWIRGQA